MGGVVAHVHFAVLHGGAQFAAAAVTGDHPEFHPQHVELDDGGEHPDGAGADAAELDQRRLHQVGAVLEAALQRVDAGVIDQIGHLHPAQYGEIQILEVHAGHADQFAKGLARAIVDNRAVLGRLGVDKVMGLQEGAAGHILDNDFGVAFDVLGHVLAEQTGQRRAARRRSQTDDDGDGFAFIIRFGNGFRGQQQSCCGESGNRQSDKQCLNALHRYTSLMRYWFFMVGGSSGITPRSDNFRFDCKGPSRAK